MASDIIARALAMKANKTMPAVSSTDAGKLATVDSNGKWAAANLTVGQGEVAVDSTLLVSGAAADAKVTGDKVNELKSAIDYREWDYSEFEISYATKVSGTVLRYDRTTESASTIDYYKIPVNEGEKWKIVGTYYKALAMYAFMDSSNNITLAYPNSVQAAVYTNATQEVLIPAGVAYLCVNDFTRISGTAQFNVYKGTHADSIQEQLDSKVSQADAAELYDCFENYSDATIINLDGEDIEKITGKMFRYDKAIENVSSVDYYIIPVSESQKYRVTSGTRSACGMYGYLDANKDFLYVYPASAQSSTPTPVTVDIVIPHGVSYLAVNDLHKVYGNLPLAVYTISTYMILKEGRESLKTMESPLFGMKLCTAGDSITEGEGTNISIPINDRPTYGKLASDYYGMDYINIGMSGRTMADVSVNGVSRNGFAVERYLLVPDDTDVLTIWFGWNDNAYGSSSMRDDYCLTEYENLYADCTAEQKAEADTHDWQTAFVGTVDSNNTKTWCGAWNFVLNYFTVTKPIKHIGVVIPFLPLGSYSVSMRDTLKQICEKYGVAYIDSADPNQIPTVGYCDSARSTNYTNYLSYRTAYTADTLHPNADGYERISRGYIPWISKM